MEEVCVPKEILLLILSFIPKEELYQLSEVNKQFKDCVFDGMYFKKLPKEIILLILSFIPKNELNKITEIDRHFKDIALDLLAPIIVTKNIPLNCDKTTTIELLALARTLEKNKTITILDV